MEEKAIVVQNLVKQYPQGQGCGRRLILGGLKGEIFGLLGPNGAGKTHYPHPV